MAYKYYQPNAKDLKDKVGDCSIRAFTKATGKTWTEIFDELIPYARDAQCLMNQKPAYEKWLEDNGWHYEGFPRGLKTTVSQLAKGLNKGTIIAYVRVGYGTHLVCIQDGDWYDTWDCGNKYIFGYYTLD